MRSEFDRFLTFQVRFDPSCAYRTDQPSNQQDWNKVMGLSTVNVHDDSVRLGWRYEPSTDVIEVGLYAYVDGARHMAEVASVPLGSWVDVTLVLAEQTVSVEVDGVSVSRPGRGAGSGLLNGTTWVMRTAYFGGDETAPHDLRVDVRDVWTDR